MTTLLCTFLGSLFAFFLFLAQPDIAVYAAIMVFGCIFVPVLIAALLYEPIKRKVRARTGTATMLLRMGSLLLLFAAGIFIWVLADVAFSDCFWQGIRKDFESQFAGFMAIGAFVALTMPLIDSWLDKWLRRKELRHP